MKDFYRSSARAQALRLRKLAQEALRHYDLEVSRLQLLSHLYNTMFQADTAFGRYVLRINLPGIRSLEQIRAEMAWLAALRHDTDLPVPQPLANRQGELVTTVQVPEVPEARHCAIFSWLPGPLLADKLSPAALEHLGQITARLHQHAQSFRLPPGSRLKKLDGVGLDQGIVLFDEPYRELVPPERAALFREALSRVEEGLGRLYQQPEPPRILHADLHQWNLKLWKGRLAVLDFDDCALGYPVQDLAISLYYFQQSPHYPVLREALRRGYETLSEWPEEYPGQVDTLIVGRGLDLANYSLITPNPDWRSRAPQFLERTEARVRAFLGR